MSVRDDILDDFRSRTRGRPVRWADGRTLAGDFEDPDATLEVFDVPGREQRGLLRDLRDVRRRAEAMLGRPLRVVFHTPEATTRHYSFIRAGAPVVVGLVRRESHPQRAVLIDRKVREVPGGPRMRIS